MVAWAQAKNLYEPGNPHCVLILSVSLDDLHMHKELYCILLMTPDVLPSMTEKKRTMRTREAEGLRAQ